MGTGKSVSHDVQARRNEKSAGYMAGDLYCYKHLAGKVNGTHKKKPIKRWAENQRRYVKLEPSIVRDVDIRTVPMQTPLLIDKLLRGRSAALIQSCCSSAKQLFDSVACTDTRSVGEKAVGFQADFHFSGSREGDPYRFLELSRSNDSKSGSRGAK